MYETQRVGDLSKVSQLENHRAMICVWVDVILKPLPQLYCLQGIVTLSINCPGIRVGQGPAGNR